MLAKNVTMDQMITALEKANQEFDGNLKFRRLDQQGRNIRFTLTVKSSRGPGSRLSAPRFWDNGKQRHLSAACWHAYGTFFDSLPAQAVLVTSGRKIRPGDRWMDRNIGSTMFPFFYSDACECDH